MDDYDKVNIKYKLKLDNDEKPYKNDDLAFPFPIYTNFPAKCLYNDQDCVNQEGENAIDLNVFKKQFWRKDQSNEELIKFAYAKFIDRETNINKKLDDAVKDPNFCLAKATMPASGQQE
jgi:hypothetical protein